MHRQLRYRTHASPSVPLLLNVRSCGYYDLDAGMTESRQPGSFLQLFWCIRGSGEFKIKQQWRALRSGNLFYYSPGESHLIRAGRDGMAYRWLTLDGPKCADLPALFHFKRWQNCGPCPDSLFADLDFWLCDATTEGEKRASLLAYEVLLSTAPAHLPNHLNREEKNTAEQIRHWIDQHHRESRLNISAAAAHFGLHRSSLYRVFIKHYGVSPVRYLNRLRVRHALGLLQQSSLPVADVAARSGIPDIAYFSRRIKEHTGYSPRAYRQKHRAMETGSGSGRQHPVIC